MSSSSKSGNINNHNSRKKFFFRLFSSSSSSTTTRKQQQLQQQQQSTTSSSSASSTINKKSKKFLTTPKFKFTKKDGKLQKNYLSNSVDEKLLRGTTITRGSIIESELSGGNELKDKIFNHQSIVKNDNHKVQLILKNNNSNNSNENNNNENNDNVNNNSDNDNNDNDNDIVDDVDDDDNSTCINCKSSSSNNNNNSKLCLSQRTINLTSKCLYRVQNTIQLIQSDGINKTDLLKSLENTVELMEAIITDEEIDINEEGDLNVNTELVPVEIRDWLTTTFSTTANRAPREYKPKFRTVANVIRAGIMVEKMFKRSNDIVSMKIPDNIAQFLKENMNLWTFDMFKLDELTGGHALRMIGLEIFLRYNIFHKFKVKVPNYENLLAKLEFGYSKHKNPYHNLVHGADVAQTCHYIIHSYQMKHWLTDLEIFASLFAALIHDFEHTGTTNNFHINTSSELTLLYNDRGVLENHHVSSVFRIMQDPDHNILTSMPKDDFREFRSLVIEMVLNTDMSTHFKQMKNMKSHLSLGEGVDKVMGLSMILHCADISHPGKHWDLHYIWTMQLLEEFFRQGDQERELAIPFSPLCDRKTILIPDSQIGFSNFIVDPSFQILGSMIELIVENMKKQGLKVIINPEEKKEIHDEYGFLVGWPPENKPNPLNHPWERHIFFNRSTWQKKLEQEKEEKSKTNDEETKKE